VDTLVVRDGAALSYRCFPAPPDRERGRIIYLHGIQSHGGWYVEAAAELARHGYTVYLPDRRGSGLNTGPRGFFGSREQLLEDLRGFIALSEREHPGTPLFLLGNCWGAKPAFAFALEEQDALAGMLLLCPGIITRPDLPRAEKLRVVRDRIIAPHRRTRVPLTNEMYTENPPYLDFIRNDPLAMREASAQFLIDAFLWDRALPRRHDLRVPLLVMQAGRDPIVDIPATRRWFDRLESPDKSYREYPESGHTLDFEDDRQQVWDSIVAWLDDHAPAAMQNGGCAAGTRTTTVARVEVLTAELPFRFAFGHALAKRRASTNVFVKLTLSDGSAGFGEGVPREYVTGETVESAVATLCEQYVPALLGRTIAGPDAVPALLDAITDRAAPADGRVVDGAARCALELALLDAVGRSYGLPVAHWLGVPQSPVVRYSAVIPFSSQRLLAIVAVLCRLVGIRHVKIKVGGDRRHDLRALRLLRRILGPRADLRVDANCAWDADAALAAIGQMRRYGISGVEQPLPAEDLDGLRRVTAATTEAIIVDESLRTPEEAADLVARHACDAFNIRVSKCGGLLQSTRIARIAADAGLICIVGAQVGESAILSAAGRHLAAHIGARYVEGSAGRLLLKGDISAARVLPGWGGRARPARGVGLGVTIDEGALRSHERTSRVFETVTQTEGAS
jgi:L-alanine-DL-glutamate epimerase-like enolase superfamily enzyme/alpha-beta hydrolase superfamily lysophospholipase